jgi:broad specificity phosphatase PhoE
MTAGAPVPDNIATGPANHGDANLPLIYMVRHGRADALRDRDPELTAEGLAQAEAVGRELHGRIGAPLRILTSPLRRCRQTAEPLARLWGATPAVEPRVVEIPTPQAGHVVRDEWLRFALGAQWPEVAQRGESLVPGFAGLLAAWREGVLRVLQEQPGDTVIFTHFVPINAAYAHALGLQKVTSFQPDNVSVTVFETSAADAPGLRLLERGRELLTPVI